MSIGFLSGKPGGGKSLYGVQKVVEELRLTKRNIVTNLPIKRARMREFLHEKYGESFDIEARLRILTHEEVGEFFLHYGPDLSIDPAKRVIVCVKKGKKQKVVEKDAPDFAERGGDGGVLYVIDEAHKYFNAREWDDIGTDVLFYASQHRHLHDDCILITQHVKNVDTQFTRLAEDFTYLRNFSKGKLPLLGGIIRTPSRFMRSTFPEMATGRPGQEASEVRFFKLDAQGLASCYETCGAVGVTAGGPEENRTKGLPFWMLFVIVFGIIGVIWVAAEGAGKIFTRSSPVQRHLGAKGAAAALPLQSTNIPPAQPVQLSPVRVDPFGAPARRVPRAERIEAKLPEESRDVFWSATWKTPGHGFRYGLTDGRVISEGDPRIKFVGTDAIQIADTIYVRPGSSFGSQPPKRSTPAFAVSNN